MLLINIMYYYYYDIYESDPRDPCFACFEIREKGNKCLRTIKSRWSATRTRGICSCWTQKVTASFPRYVISVEFHGHYVFAATDSFDGPGRGRKKCKSQSPTTNGSIRGLRYAHETAAAALLTDGARKCRAATTTFAAAADALNGHVGHTVWHTGAVDAAPGSYGISAATVAGTMGHGTVQHPERGYHTVAGLKSYVTLSVPYAPGHRVTYYSRMTSVNDEILIGIDFEEIPQRYFYRFLFLLHRSGQKPQAV